MAAGRVTAYVASTCRPFTPPQGSLLITEAGGIVSDIDGHPWTIRSDSFVGGADRRLHEELLHLATRADELIQ